MSKGNVQVVEQVQDVSVSTGKEIKKKIPQTIFIEKYQKSNSHKEVAEKLGLTVSCVISRSKKYKTLGIPLKKMSKQKTNSINVEAARKQIEELNKILNQTNTTETVSQ